MSIHIHDGQRLQACAPQRPENLGRGSGGGHGLVDERQIRQGSIQRTILLRELSQAQRGHEADETPFVGHDGQNRLPRAAQGSDGGGSARGRCQCLGGLHHPLGRRAGTQQSAVDRVVKHVTAAAQFLRVDRRAREEARRPRRDHDCEHHRQNQRELAGHLHDDENGRHGGTCGARESGTHADHGKNTDGRIR